MRDIADSECGFSNRDDALRRIRSCLNASARAQNEGFAKLWYEVANIIAIRNEVNIKEIVN